jgi:hypothetical protein
MTTKQKTLHDLVDGKYEDAPFDMGAPTLSQIEDRMTDWDLIVTEIEHLLTIAYKWRNVLSEEYKFRVDSKK